MVEINREKVARGAAKAAKIALGFEELPERERGIDSDKFRAGLLRIDEEADRPVGRPDTPLQRQEPDSEGFGISPEALMGEEEEEVNFPPENLVGGPADDSGGGVPRNPEIDQLDRLPEEDPAGDSASPVFDKRKEEKRTDRVPEKKTTEPRPPREQAAAPGRTEEENRPGWGRKIMGGLRRAYSAARDKSVVRQEETSIAEIISRDRGFKGADRLLRATGEVAVPMRAGKEVVFIKVNLKKTRAIEDVLAVLHAEGITCTVSLAGGLMRVDGRKIGFFGGREVGRIQRILEAAG